MYINKFVLLITLPQQTCMFNKYKKRKQTIIYYAYNFISIINLKQKKPKLKHFLQLVYSSIANKLV